MYTTNIYPFTQKPGTYLHQHEPLGQTSLIKLSHLLFVDKIARICNFFSQGDRVHKAPAAKPSTAYLQGAVSDRRYTRIGSKWHVCWTCAGITVPGFNLVDGSVGQNKATLANVGGILGTIHWANLSFIRWHIHRVI